ncbi:MAG: HAD family phosphatase [Patescibacteria group bacterium]
MKTLITNRKSKLVFFGVEGVLLNVVFGGFKDILTFLGKEEDVNKINEEYQKRKHLGPWGLENLVELCKGFSREELTNVSVDYCNKNLMMGAKNLIREIKKRGFLVGAISSGPQFLLDALNDILDLDFVFGLKIEFKDNVATGKIFRKIDRFIKVDILKEKMKELNLSKENVTVIGDSITDIPMAEEAGFFIAFNSKSDEVKQKANVVVDKKDLKEILKFI